MGQPPQYSDIDRVFLTNQGCGSTLRPAQDPPTLECSRYWIYIDDNGTKYSQYNLLGGVGTFDSAYSLSAARAILMKEKFFHVSLPDLLPPTDTDLQTVTAWVCGVMLSVQIYAGDSDDAGVSHVIQELSEGVQSSSKRKVSDLPQVLPIIFRPW
jgi:hypothetical protein